MMRGSAMAGSLPETDGGRVVHKEMMSQMLYGQMVQAGRAQYRSF